MGITSNEFHGLAIRKEAKKSTTKKPTVKAPKFSKELKQKLVPYGNQAPLTRSAVT